jgi:hypothetical protein
MWQCQRMSRPCRRSQRSASRHADTPPQLTARTARMIGLAQMHQFVQQVVRNEGRHLDNAAPYDGSTESTIQRDR